MPRKTSRRSLPSPVPGSVTLEALRAEHLALERESAQLARDHEQLHNERPHDMPAHAEHLAKLLAFRRKLSAHLAKLKDLKPE